MNQVIPEAAVEAAAIALYPELREEWRVPPPPWESLDDDAKIDAIAMARLALEAAAPHMLAGAWDRGMVFSAGILNGEEYEPSFRKDNPYRPTP